MAHVAVNPGFDQYNESILAEVPRGPDDPSQQFAVHRRRRVNGVGVAFITFDLVIYRNDDDMTFYGLEASELHEIGKSLIRLSGVQTNGNESA